MNTQINNFFNNKMNDIKNRQIPENRKFSKDEPKEYILTNINSICIKEEYFTNFLPNTEGKEELKGEIKRVFDNLIKGKELMYKYFEPRDLTNKESLKIKRVEKIIKSYGTIEELDLLKIRKYKNRKEKGFQLYTRKIDENTVEILLIDLYHLAILSEYKIAENGNKIKVTKESIKKRFDKKLIKYDLCLKEYLKLD